MQARKICLLMLIAFCSIGALMTRAKDGATPRPASLPKLQLIPDARLEMSPVFTAKDSFVVRFRLEVPATEKYQRHRCLISADAHGFKLEVPPAQQWMLRHDTLMVLSDIEMTLRAQKRLAASFVLEFKFSNLDKPKQPAGIAKLILGRVVEVAPALTADSSATLSAIANNDSAVKSQVAVSDSASHHAGLDSTQAEQRAQEGSDVMPWILIGLLLSGFAVMALLSMLSRKQSREAMEKIATPRFGEMSKTVRREERPTSFESMMRSPATSAAKNFAPEPSPLSTSVEEQTPSHAVPAASVLALTKNERGMDEITAMPDLQAALAQLCVVTAEVQKAVGKQYEALQKLSVQVETARMLPAQAASLQTKPRLQFAFDAQETAPAPNGETTSTNNRAALEELGVRVSSSQEATEKYEEIADAIASLAAASSIKPPTVSAQTLAPKLELLRRIHAGLQALAAFCRTTATGVPAETVEGLGRKVLDLCMSYEAWASDQSLKLPLILQRPANGNDNARRKIVESLLDGLYETRKLAAQGALYFERRLSQLLEQDLPRLRTQFSGLQNAELRKIWESMA